MGNTPDTIKFTADVMLGRLARHLVHLGFDCLYKPTIDDEKLVECAASRGGVILTRDMDIIQQFDQPKQVFVLAEDSLKYQLRSLKEAFELTINPNNFFTRCSKCNETLTSVPKARVIEEVPPGTREWIESFYRCPTCETVYWKGSHYRDFLARLNRWNLMEGNN